MPKLWNDTIEAHRTAVREAILDSAAGLAAEHGVRAVTMSQIADVTGIGRATLYKYFGDVEAILLAWHDRQIKAHLARLAEVKDQGADAGERLAAVLQAYARIAHESHGHHNSELGAFLHRDERLAGAEKELRRMLRELVSAAAAEGAARDDVAPEELVTYCLHALGAAPNLPSGAAVRRLVDVVLAGLTPHA